MVVGELEQETELLVIGGGPGGYAAAFRAADLGMEVTMVNMDERPGGECLFRGCIPSKTLLHLTELIYDAEHAKEMGVAFQRPHIDIEGLRKWKNEVIDRLSKGLVNLSERRGVQLIQGRAEFESSERVRLQGSEVSRIKFRHAILATGSRPAPFAGIDFQKTGRIMNSTGALELTDIPESLLVLGGGYVGLELGSIYAVLGSQVTLIEQTEAILPGTDPDLKEPLLRRLKEIFKELHFKTRVTDIKERDGKVEVHFEQGGNARKQTFHRVLVAIGRKPNSENLGLDKTRVKINDRGFVEADDRQRTADERILAVGDVVGGPLLAHKALREGHVAAEVIAGKPAAFDVRAIPAVVYTDPQVAWVGLTEMEAQRRNKSIQVERFSWKFSGRAATMGTTDGMTKIILDPETERILGVGMTGRDTEGLIAEGVLAIEMGALAQDLALSIHPHPTLSETVEEAAEIFLGSAVHTMPRERSVTR